MIFFSCILVSIAGLFKAVMDTLDFHYSTSVFSRLDPQFWNPEISSWNKYKNGDKDQGSAFPFSTTLFVMFTDGWHLMQSGFLFSMTAAIVTYSRGLGKQLLFWELNIDSFVLGGVIDFIVLGVLFRVVFSFFYWVFRV